MLPRCPAAGALAVAAALVSAVLAGAGLAAGPAAAADQRVWVGGGTATSAYRYVPAGEQAGVPFGVHTTSAEPVTVRVDASALAGHVTVTGISGTGCTWSASGGGTCTFLLGGLTSARVLVRANPKGPAGPAGRLLFRLAGQETVAASALIDVRVGGDVTDLAVAAADVTGPVGGTVTVPVTVRNLGPNTSPRWELRLVRVPDGVVFTGGAGCARGTGGVIVCTASPHLRVGASQTVRPAFRIDRPGSDPVGGFTLHPGLADPNRANEDLAFTVRVPGAQAVAPPQADGLPPIPGRQVPNAPAGTAPSTQPAASPPGALPPPASGPVDTEIGGPGEEQSGIGAATRLGGRTPVSRIALAVAGFGVLLGLGALEVATRRRRRAAQIHAAGGTDDGPAAPTGAELPVVGTGWTRSGVVGASGAYYPPGDRPGDAD
jgi:hypothetical protein